MAKKNTWATPGWPFELDLLALLFLLAAVLIPFSLFNGYSPEVNADTNLAVAKLKEQTYILWSIGICVLFVMHLALAGANMEIISTPFLHLVSPMVFALLAYFRVHSVASDIGQPVWYATGEPKQIVLLALGVFFLTFLAARLRMLRYLLRFRDTRWDLVLKSSYDSSYLELIAQFRPLVYPPRRYRACEEGFIVEGFFYIIAIPFAMVQTINPVRNVGFSSAGNYYASNTQSMVRLELLDSGKPIFISPDQRDEFIQYCARHVARTRPASTRQGTYTGGATHAGAAKPTHPPR